MSKIPSPYEGGSVRYGLVGDSPAIEHVLRIIEKLRDDVSPVLICGETGVGKELVARALHNQSRLAGNTYLPVDSASLVGALMESELFGHVRGAFTGATDNKIGLVRAADGGTLFLDEIGELSPDLQAKLLRLLQEREVRPIGATKPVKVNVRVIAATNRDLAKAVALGQFRQDLYYRLNVIKIRVPALRERKQDIPALIHHFSKIYATEGLTISEQAFRRLVRHEWPGNVRQLENTIRRMVVLRSNPIITTDDLPSTVRFDDPEERDGGSSRGIPCLAELEKRHILHVLEHTNGDVPMAAERLKIGKTTLYRKIKEYNSEQGAVRSKLNEHRQGHLFD